MKNSSKKYASDQIQRRQWHPTPVLLPGKSHGWRRLVSCSPWGHEESDTTERLHFHFSLSCIGEGNGNPLQCSCLENSRGGGAWWAATYGVAQSRTRLKRPSSSSSNQIIAAGLQSSQEPVRGTTCVCAQLLSHVQLFAIQWTQAHQAPLSLEFPRQEYWSG